jgi:hypothetical protein
MGVEKLTENFGVVIDKIKMHKKYAMGLKEFFFDLS